MSVNFHDTRNCSFCTLSTSRLLFTNSLAFSIYDGYPISQGHALIIPQRHIASLFETTAEEQQALFAMLQQVKAEIQRQYQPSGYNIGINDGLAAGQTVMHLHIHLIPRYTGDIADPRGGVRWIFPDKAKYW